MQGYDDTETIVETFQIQIDDGHGGVVLQPVTVTIYGVNDTPVIVVDQGNPLGANDTVYESGLATGSAPLTDGEFAGGTFTLSDADGFDDLQSVTINGTTHTIAELILGTSTFPGLHGVLTVTAYDPLTGIATYTYELTSPTIDVPAVTETDVFTLTVFDGTATSAPATITIDIVDDIPTAVANTNSVTEGGIVTGNVLTDGTDDVFGADGPTTTVPAGGIVGVAAGSSTAVPVSGNVGVQISGSFGKLTLNADGSYSYDGDPNVVPPAGATDTFVYTIKDGDGDTSTTTLTINLTDSGLAAATGQRTRWSTRRRSISTQTAPIWHAVLSTAVIRPAPTRPTLAIPLWAASPAEPVLTPIRSSHFGKRRRTAPCQLNARRHLHLYAGHQPYDTSARQPHNGHATPKQDTR